MKLSPHPPPSLSQARFPQGDVFPAGAEGRFPRDAEALVQDALRPEERRLGCRGKGARKDPFWTQGWFKGMNWGAMGRRAPCCPAPAEPARRTSHAAACARLD